MNPHAAHWTPAGGWHDCPAPIVALVAEDGTLDVDRPDCPTHPNTEPPIIRATWHHCAADRWETLAGTPAGWGMPDAVTPSDVAAEIADRIRSVPGWGEYSIEIRRAGRTTSTTTGGRCDHRRPDPIAHLAGVRTPTHRHHHRTD
jgi:hypothetical protein